MSDAGPARALDRLGPGPAATLVNRWTLRALAELVHEAERSAMARLLGVIYGAEQGGPGAGDTPSRSPRGEERCS